MKELQRQASPNIVIALAGNKADLASKRAVEFQVGGMDRIWGLGGGISSLHLDFPRLLGLQVGPHWEAAGALYLLSFCNSSMGRKEGIVVCLSLFVVSRVYVRMDS